MSTDFSDIIKQKKQLKDEATSEKQHTSSEKGTSASEKKKNAAQPKTEEKSVMGRPKTKPNLGQEVNITAKVPKAWRIHWMTEIKRHDTTLREEIIEALTQKYGLPKSED